MLQHHLTKAWNLFVENVRTYKASRETISRVMKRMQHKQLAGAFDSYAQNVEIVRELRGRVQKVIGRWRAPGIRKAFDYWMEYIEITVLERDFESKELARQQAVQVAEEKMLEVERRSEEIVRDMESKTLAERERLFVSSASRLHDLNACFLRLNSELQETKQELQCTTARLDLRMIMLVSSIEQSHDAIRESKSSLKETGDKLTKAYELLALEREEHGIDQVRFAQERNALQKKLADTAFDRQGWVAREDVHRLHVELKTLKDECTAWERNCKQERRRHRESLVEAGFCRFQGSMMVYSFCEWKLVAKLARKHQLLHAQVTERFLSLLHTHQADITSAPSSLLPKLALRGLLAPPPSPQVSSRITSAFGTPRVSLPDPVKVLLTLKLPTDLASESVVNEALLREKLPEEMSIASGYIPALTSCSLSVSSSLEGGLPTSCFEVEEIEWDVCNQLCREGFDEKAKGFKMEAEKRDPERGESDNQDFLYGPSSVVRNDRDKWRQWAKRRLVQSVEDGKSRKELRERTKSYIETVDETIEIVIHGLAANASMKDELRTKLLCNPPQMQGFTPAAVQADDMPMKCFLSSSSDSEASGDVSSDDAGNRAGEELETASAASAGCTDVESAQSSKTIQILMTIVPDPLGLLDVVPRHVALNLQKQVQMSLHSEDPLPVCA